MNMTPTIQEGFTARPSVQSQEPLRRGGSAGGSSIVFVKPMALYNHDSSGEQAHIYHGSMIEDLQLLKTQSASSAKVYIPDALCSETVNWSANGESLGYFAAVPIEASDALDIDPITLQPKKKTMYLIIDNSWLIR